MIKENEARFEEEDALEVKKAESEEKEEKAEDVFKFQGNAPPAEAVTTTGAARRYHGRTCAVVNCRRSQGKDGPKDGISFFNFPKNRNREQHMLWVKALKRVNRDGSPWEPGAHDVVCSDHFVTGKPSPTRYDPGRCARCPSFPVPAEVHAITREHGGGYNRACVPHYSYRWV